MKQKTIDCLADKIVPLRKQIKAKSVPAKKSKKV